MFSVEALLEVLTLTQVGVDRYAAPNLPIEHGVVLGGQLVAQALTAGLIGQDGKTVKTLHTVFVRSASPEGQTVITVDRTHCGGTLACSTVTVSQGDRVCTRSLVLLTADEPDVIRHADRPRILEIPDEGPGSGTWDIQVVGDVDLFDPDAVGPAELDVWNRFEGAPVDPGTNQALLAFATDSFLIGTAMRPHAGVGMAQAHVTLSTGVLSHTLTFHEPALAGSWLLLSHRSPYAGRGRSYGRADVYRGDGQLVASFVQDAMIRAKVESSSRL